MTKIDLNTFTYKFLKVRYIKSNPPLTIEFIPKICQGRSLFHNWPQKWWDKLRKMVYSRADRKCEICSAGGQVSCHEVWEFDIVTRTQKLKYLMCICSDCHRAKHYGHAYLSGHGKEAILHLMKINNWELEETLDYIERCYVKHSKFKGIKFKKKLNVNILSDFIAKFQIIERRTKRVKAKDRNKKNKQITNASGGNYNKKRCTR